MKLTVSELIRQLEFIVRQEKIEPTARVELATAVGENRPIGVFAIDAEGQRHILLWQSRLDIDGGDFS